MADGFGIIPFSIGGTTASGYSLVKAFTLTYNDYQYNISSSSYDFGVVAYMGYDGFYIQCHIYFTNTPATYIISLTNLTSTNSKNESFTVTSTYLSHSRGNTNIITSIALFKFN